MYSVGQGVQKNDETAFYWLEKSAQQGMAMSADELGVMYGDGRGVKQDLVKSYVWIAFSEKNGYPQAIADKKFVMAMMTNEQIAEAEDQAKK